MISKLKIFILCIVAISSICSCVKKIDYQINDAAYPGYVAFDYTGIVINNYFSILKNIYGLNIYISQPTIEKRDSIDRIYFSDIKIVQEENRDIWILTYLNSNGYKYMSINTHGKSLKDDNAKWTISLYDGNFYYNQVKYPEFEIEKIGELHWHINNHDNNNYDFHYSSEWDVKLNSTGNFVTLEGNGSLLSFASPSLKLDFTITNPFEAKYNHNNLSLISGAIKILATDVDKSITEETAAEIISDHTIRITYKNNVENYDHSLSW